MTANGYKRNVSKYEQMKCLKLICKLIQLFISFLTNSPMPLLYKISTPCSAFIFFKRKKKVIPLHFLFFFHSLSIKPFNLLSLCPSTFSLILCRIDTIVSYNSRGLLCVHYTIKQMLIHILS